MPKITKAAVLDLAKDAVADRGPHYGPPYENFLRIARLWKAHLVNVGLFDPDVLSDDDKGITPADVAIMHGLVKDARLANTPNHLDSWVDKAGYAACGANIVCNALPTKPEPEPEIRWFRSEQYPMEEFEHRWDGAGWIKTGNRRIKQ